MRLLILLSLSLSLSLSVVFLLNITSQKILSIFRGLREFNCHHQLGWTPLHVAETQGTYVHLMGEWNAWNHMYTCTYIVHIL